jgi:hypothetical protein
MRPYDDVALFPVDERLRELALLLATGVLRLPARPAPAAVPIEHSDPKNPLESRQDCLELPGATVLSVHTG